jgi:2-oxoglutarate ferredoxin oxidoreductase subunit beta
VTLGATFVARGFSGDKAQLVPLIKAAVQHKGAAIIDVVSPCVAFNNHHGSTKSYDYVRTHNETVNFLDYMPEREPIVNEGAPGTVSTITLHDGGAIRVLRVDESYDPRSKVGVMSSLEAAREAGEVVTGLLYLDESVADLHDAQNTVDMPLNALRDVDLVPGSAALAKLNASLR